MLAAGPGLQTEALKRLMGRPAPDRQVPQPHAGPSQALVRWPCPDCSTPYFHSSFTASHSGKESDQKVIDK